MAKFIKFNVVNTADAAALLTQGTKLINVELITLETCLTMLQQVL